MRDRTNISDALENHEENKNKDLSSTICEFVSLECTPQVRYTILVFQSPLFYLTVCFSFFRLSVVLNTTWFCWVCYFLSSVNI